MTKQSPLSHILPLIGIIVVIVISVLIVRLSRQSTNLGAAASVGKGATFIFMATDPIQLAKYQTLAGPTVRVFFRTTGVNPIPELDQWDKQGWHYYVTAASSDFAAFQKSSEYIEDRTLLSTVARRPGFEGFYFHEMLTYKASTSGWNWDTARDTLDWAWVQQVVQIARANGKMVIWSEPTYAWRTLFEDKNKTIDQLYREWSNTLIPMYATNFTSPEIDASKMYAKLVSTKYAMQFGESHQAWRWRDTAQKPSQQGSFTLALDGWNSGARYFQFEGTAEDTPWDSPYLLGIRQFALFLSPPVPAPTPASLPTPKLLPVPKPAVPQPKRY